MGYAEKARRRWPRAGWIVGHGRYASVATCPHGPHPEPITTVMLFESFDEAAHAKREIDWGGCGGRCRGNHRVVDLDSRA